MDDFKHCVYKLCESQDMLAQTRKTKELNFITFDVEASSYGDRCVADVQTLDMDHLIVS